MTEKYIQKGEKITQTSSGAVTVGQLATFGADDYAGIALNAAAGSGEKVVYQVDGVFKYAVAAGASTTGFGDPAYFDSGSDEITDDADTGSNPKVGVFVTPTTLKLNA